MWFKWKKTALGLIEQQRRAQAEQASQVERIEALKQALAQEQAANVQSQRQLDYYRGVSGHLIRFSTSVAQLGDSFEYLAGQLSENQTTSRASGQRSLEQPEGFQRAAGQGRRHGTWLERGLEQGRHLG
ncbi:hypothetical protein [Pseudomonas sp. FEMGT703P]